MPTLAELPQEVIHAILNALPLSPQRLLQLAATCTTFQHTAIVLINARFEEVKIEENPYPVQLMAVSAFTFRHGTGHVAKAIALTLNGDVHDGAVLRLEERGWGSDTWQSTVAKVENGSPHDGSRCFSHFSEEPGGIAPISWSHTAWKQANCRLGGPMFLPNRIFDNLSRVRL